MSESVVAAIDAVAYRIWEERGEDAFILRMSPAGYDDLKREVLRPDRVLFCPPGDSCTPLTEIAELTTDIGHFHLVIDTRQREPFRITRWQGIEPPQRLHR